MTISSNVFSHVARWKNPICEQRSHPPPQGQVSHKGYSKSRSRRTEIHIEPFCFCRRLEKPSASGFSFFASSSISHCRGKASQCWWSCGQMYARRHDASRCCLCCDRPVGSREMAPAAALFRGCLRHLPSLGLQRRQDGRFGGPRVAALAATQSLVIGRLLENRPSW